MEFERIVRTIRWVSAWAGVRNYFRQEDDKEILKPLNKLINFETHECIMENHFCL
jgi:hypothetical protein